MRVQRTSRRWRSWVAPLVLSTFAFAPRVGGIDDELAKASGLKSDIGAYLGALDRAAVLERTVGPLGLRLRLFPNAWHLAILERLSEALSTDDGLEQDDRLEVALTELRAVDPAMRKRLQRHAGFRLDLIHRSYESGGEPDRAQPVHFLRARLERAVRLSIAAEDVAWQGWKEDNLELLKRLRVARHFIVRNNQRVPYMSPVKPVMARWVFRGKSAALYGLVSPALLRWKRGQLRATISYEELLGAYDDRHIIDLNNAANVWNQDRTVTLRAALPFHLPRMPVRLERFLEHVDDPRETAPPTPGPKKPARTAGDREWPLWAPGPAGRP